MKRIIALLLMICLLTGSAALAQEPGAAGNDTVNHLTVGNPTPMRGQFFTDMWGNATSDIDVRDLLHGYNLIYWDAENGMFTTNPTVVQKAGVTRDEYGNRIYVLNLYEDLYYSDGTQITAWDYAFSYLFSIAPEISEIGGTPLRREHFLGYEEYMNGSGHLEAVHVISPFSLSVTLDHKFLPFFYEAGLLYCNPYPIKVIAPGVTVQDDGDGVYLANENKNIIEPVFSGELLERTVMDPITGYLSHPSVVSGPYTLTDWDGVTAEFKRNRYFKGDVRGEVPQIETLTYTLALNDSMIDRLVDGEFGLLNKVMREDKITEGLNRMEEGQLAMSNYPRSGLSHISFACERATVSDTAVRQAIACCFDRDAATYDYTGSFGMRVDGYYGIGQWMYGLIIGTVAPPVTPPEDENDAAAQSLYEAELSAFDALNLDGLDPYTLDTERAARLLDEDGWTINEEGLREKDGVVLDLTMIYPQGNNINETLEKNLVPNLASVGIRLTMTAMPMPELLSKWYKQEDRDMDMIYVASNFDLVFDPSVHFQQGVSGEHNWAYTNLNDEPLFAAAIAMRKTEPGDVLTYMLHWVEFQERFNEILPMIPVYSNIYFDFYTRKLQNYFIAENIDWPQAIIPAYLGDAPAYEDDLGDD